MLAAIRWTAKPPITIVLWAAKPFMLVGLNVLDQPLYWYTKGEGLRETTGGFLISKKDARFFHSSARWLITLAIAATAAASVLDPETTGVTGTLERLVDHGAEILALVILGTILLVRPYRLLQEVIVKEMVKLYERVERKYRPDSYRQRAAIIEEKNQELQERTAELERREENLARREEEDRELRELRKRVAELECQIRRNGSRRRRWRRNSPPPRE